MNDNELSDCDTAMTSPTPIEKQKEPESILDRLRFNVQIDDDQRIRRVEKLATWMDSAFRIPGTSRRVGLDSLIGLLPGVGDLSTFAVGCFIIREAWVLNLPKRHLLRMGWNTTFDMVLGSVPLVGDLFDFAFKSNSKNADIIVKHFREQKTNQPINSLTLANSTQASKKC